MVATPRALDAALVARVSVGHGIDAELGPVIGCEEYHPYGTTAWHAEDSSLTARRKRYRYTWKERDTWTQLAYHGARYYLPWLGRWESADPAGMVDGPNRYAYVRGNPISRRDPDGLGTVEEKTGVSADLGDALSTDVAPRIPEHVDDFKLTAELTDALVAVVSEPIPASHPGHSTPSSVERGTALNYLLETSDVTNYLENQSQKGQVDFGRPGVRTFTDPRTGKQTNVYTLDLPGGLIDPATGGARGTLIVVIHTHPDVGPARNQASPSFSAPGLTSNSATGGGDLGALLSADPSSTILLFTIGGGNPAPSPSGSLPSNTDLPYTLVVRGPFDPAEKGGIERRVSFLAEGNPDGIQVVRPKAIERQLRHLLPKDTPVGVFTGHLRPGFPDELGKATLTPVVTKERRR